MHSRHLRGWLDLAMIIEQAVLSDLEQLIDVGSEISAFYGLPTEPPREERRASTQNALFGDDQGTKVLVVRDGHTVAALASYTFVWPALGCLRAIYLKELYVRAGYRRQGIGLRLMKAVKADGRAHQCVRIDWTVDDGNRDAADFYSRLGGVESGKSGWRVVL